MECRGIGVRRGLVHGFYIYRHFHCMPTHMPLTTHEAVDAFTEEIWYLSHQPSDEEDNGAS